MSNAISLDALSILMREQFLKTAPHSEFTRLADGLGRVLARDAVTQIDIPGFDRSAMDGYAVRAEDILDAGKDAPVVLKKVGEVRMGQTPNFTVGPGQCAYIPTGGRMPVGADSVVMVEYTEAADDGSVLIKSSIQPGKNVALAGDDVKTGNVVLRGGTKLRPHDLGALAAMGLDEIEVFKKLRVGVISTGDELVEPGAELSGAAIYDINSHTLSSGVINDGGIPIRYGIVRDELKQLRGALDTALDQCDLILISGGSSVGTKDLTHGLIEAVGNVIVHGVAIKPGKPTIIGKIAGKPVFGIPGHPVSAFLIYLVVVRPLLLQMTGIADVPDDSVSAVLTADITPSDGRDTFVPVCLKSNGPELYATPLSYKSGLITTLSGAGGFVRVPRGCPGYSTGEKASVLCLF